MSMVGDKYSKSSVKQRQLILYSLVIVLVFEGLIRKLVPYQIGLIVFFIKDFLSLYSLLIIFNTSYRYEISKLATLNITMIYAFIPLLIVTFFFDPVLSIFGIKQYLLYGVVGILVPISFPPNQRCEFFNFVSFFALLLIPTTLIAILQNALPPSHWLNLSVSGDSLENFSASGYLRVSSTFSFTGQYSFFLNGVCPFFVVRIFATSELTQKKDNFKFFSRIVIPILLSVSLLVGAFITGGRTAVLGCGTMLLIGSLFTTIKFPKQFFGKLMFAAIFVFCTIQVVSIVKPEYFAAYEKRSSGHSDKSHSAEFAERISDSMFDWTDWILDKDITTTLFGGGLGVMSNGADKISSYANTIRTKLWTEADVRTTVWEGGVYLFIVWYGFRIYMIYFCFRIWKSIKNIRLATCAAFLLSHVVVIGLIGQIAMQPPIAIWWWLSVGSMITLKGFDRVNNSPRSAKRELLALSTD